MDSIGIQSISGPDENVGSPGTDGTDGYAPGQGPTEAEQGSSDGSVSSNITPTTQITNATPTTFGGLEDATGHVTTSSSSSSSSSNSDSGGGGGGMSTNTKVAIAVPVAVVGAAIIAAIIFFLIRRRRASANEPPNIPTSQRPEWKIPPPSSSPPISNLSRRPHQHQGTSARCLMNMKLSLCLLTRQK